MTEAMPFLQKYDITFLRPPTIVGRFFVRQNRRQNKLNRCPQRRAARPADFAVDKRNLKW